MAVYFLNLKTFGRANGSSAVSAIAYRAGERIRDEHNGKTYDHSHREDVMHKEIVLPTEFSNEEMAWARDRASLWNSAEHAETRKNARVAREYLVALPVELSAEQRVDLVRGFSQELSDHYRFAVDYAVHAPRNHPGSDPRNYHAHLLATTREVTQQGLGEKTSLEWSDGRRIEAGLGPAVKDLLLVRERWAGVANQALREARLDVRIDHRVYRKQDAGEELYARNVSESARADQRPTREPARPQSLEEIRRQAREEWLQMRGRENSAKGRGVASERTRDDDMGL